MWIIKIIAVFIALVLGYVITGYAGQEKSLTPIEMSQHAMSMIMVDKKILMELIEDARKQGSMLNVAAYVYNDVTGTWDKARTLCNKEGDK